MRRYRTTQSLRCSGQSPEHLLPGDPVQDLAYDARGRLARITVYPDPDTPLTETLAYDGVGNLTRRTDRAGRVTDHRYDALGRLVETIDPAGYATGYRYDTRDNLLAVHNARGIAIRRYGYDKRNHPLTETLPTGEVITQHYDGRGQLIERRAAGGQITRHTYDGAGQLTQTRDSPHPEAAETETPERTLTYTYDPAGRLSGYQDATSQASYTYDAAGRLTVSELTLDELSFTQRYSYYHNGRKKTYTGPHGHTESYTYDRANRFASLTTPEGTIRVERYHGPQPARTTLPGGLTRQATYDGLGRVRTLTARTPDGTVLQDYAYTYDAADNLTALDTEHGPYRYGYDDLDRLARADYLKWTPLSRQKLTKFKIDSEPSG